MPKAVAYSTTNPQSAPLRPLADWINHLKRRRAAARKARAARKRQRAVTERRLAKADAIIKEIVESGDLIGRRTAAPEDWPVPVTFVLLALEPWAFRELCDYGADLEDAEDTNDREPTEADHGEMALGWSTSPAQHLHGLAEESEPSLGSLGMTDQRRWTEGSAVPYGADLELDRSDEEPSLGASEVVMAGSFSPRAGLSDPELVRCNQEGWSRGSSADDREHDPADHGEPDYDNEPDDRRLPRVPSIDGGSIAVPATDPTGRAGMWVMQKRSA
jgi:hypothetical protein